MNSTPTDSDRRSPGRSNARPKKPQASSQVIRARLAEKNLKLAGQRDLGKTVIASHEVPKPASANRPRRLGDYTILRLIGEGGMGAVFVGYCERLEREVAVKVLPDELAGNSVYVARFYREARNALYLNHPHIVRGLAVGQDPATRKHFLVMEYVDGPSAHDLREQMGQMQVGDAVSIMRDVALGLEYAHARCVIHRDIKPDNILVTQSGLGKLADLGLAKRLDDQASELTNTYGGFGTPHYMPYEQTRDARAADARSDLFALGATVYHLVTGQVPFAGNNALEIAERKAHGAYTCASKLQPGVPSILDSILARLLARDPEDRYQTASELLVEVERSGLAAQVPSFIDPLVALRDPQMKARLLNPPDPTRIECPPSDGEAGLAEHWYLRFQDEHGQRQTVKATTAEVVQRLLSGGLEGSCFASRQRRGPFKPLESYPEFSSRGEASERQHAPRWWQRLWRK